MMAPSVIDERASSPAGAGSSPAPGSAGEPPAVWVAYAEYVQLRYEANYRRCMHERAVERAQWIERRHQHELTKSRAREAAQQTVITTLRSEIEMLQAKVRDLRQRVFGTHTEQSRVVNPGVAAQGAPLPRRPRGQRRGQRGHGRRLASQLPQRVETLGVAQPVCPGCGAALAAMPGVESREVVEVEVRA